MLIAYPLIFQVRFQLGVDSHPDALPCKKSLGGLLCPIVTVVILWASWLDIHGSDHALTFKTFCFAQDHGT